MINVELRDEIDEIRREMMRPIDFDQLIADGVLEKWGDGYQILDYTRLPRHARLKIIGVSEARPYGMAVLHFESLPEPRD